MKRIVLFVTGVHCIVLLALKSIPAPHKKEQGPIRVTTRTLSLPTPTPPVPTSASDTTTRVPPLAQASHPEKQKKAAAFKALQTTPKRPKSRSRASAKRQRNLRIPSPLAYQLQESIAKIDQTSHKGIPTSQLQTPKGLPKLKVEGRANGDVARYISDLTLCLKRSLTLPEVGEVKVELCIEHAGLLKSYRIISSHSKKNQRHLENMLGSVRYPAFIGSLKSKQESTFVVSFSNH